MDVFVKNITGDIFVGKVWNEVTTVYPDFTHPNASKYWSKQFERFYSEIKFDGAWIDMNEPANFLDGQGNGCPNTTYDFPQYVPGGVEPLHTHTLCMSSKHHESIHYNIHSVYAFNEAIITNKLLKTLLNKRPFVISRASFAGLGHYSGNWNGDILSTWDDMRWSIPYILNFNMFGVSMAGADICGFEENTTIELCSRWSALGAFYPFSRNHNSNDTIEQDPVILGPQVTAAAKQSLTTRYFLLPFLYTLFYKSHVYGDPVVRPLFFEYPTDPKTFAIDEQFLWGRSLMIIPILYPNVSNVNGYFPNDTWYDYYTGKMYVERGSNILIHVPIDRVHLAIRGGFILPAQFPSDTTTKSRLNGFFLIVALNDSKMAEGELFWDDGDSLDSLESSKYNIIEFKAYNNYLKTIPVMKGYDKMPKLETVKVLGCERKPKSILANGVVVSFQYNKYNQVLRIFLPKLSLLNPNEVKILFI
ncbi:lysosomal alpha-glucosidase-like isoform X2 [Centruroides sculpturatus]|uniref:lysosomal alpha-glucosidase-like isoform X2 n=1 Tax=Centruroides sculpturatus TaxID=218467 RepID=UPI000C6CDEEC|nr:lysosomal alpha-glucosidase-like isoform X2 [Centruroides sculpturatus]